MINEDIESRKEEVSEPWFVDQRSFYPSENQDIISGNLTALKENHAMLTLVTAEGKSYNDVLMIDVDGNKIQVDKPLDWEENGDSFRIFFRDSDDYWCFFYSGNFSAGPFSLSLDIPGRLFYLQRRKYKRILAPVGTRAMVKKNGNDLMQTVYVMVISAAGMLFYDVASADGHTVGSYINDIVVSLPCRQEHESENGFGPRKLLPLIHKGKVVRTFVDKETSRSCYGISFEYDSGYVKDTLCRMISEISASA